MTGFVFFIDHGQKADSLRFLCLCLCVSLHNSLNNLLKKKERPADPLSWSNEFLLLNNWIQWLTLNKAVFRCNALLFADKLVNHPIPSRTIIPSYFLSVTFLQAIWRRIQSLGLASLYHDDVDFSIAVSFLFVLNLVPPNLMVTYWDVVRKAFTSFSRDGRCKALYYYAKRAFIGTDRLLSYEEITGVPSDH